jgi:hypothetical protein
MPEFHREEKRVGLHSAAFSTVVLHAKGLGLALSRKIPRAAKVRLKELPAAANS